MDPRRFRLTAALAAALCLALPAAAHAAWFAADAVDGPSPDILALGGIDIAPQGQGAIVYLKRDAGFAHVFASRLVGGVWSPPERVDAGIAEEASSPVISLSDSGQIFVAWASAGRVLVASTPSHDQAFGAPTTLATGGARDPHIDVGINGTAYVVYAIDGGGGSDVRAARYGTTGWQGINTIDIDPNQPAGAGAGRPRVAVSAEGFAVAVWGEGHADGRPRVYARRLTGLNLSSFPQEVSVPEYGGAAGGTADSPDIDIEEDGSFAWVAFRQDIGGASRALARRLVGSQFDPPAALDDGSGASAPRVSINGRGIGLGASAGGGGSVFGSLLQLDVFAAPARWDAAGGNAAANPVVASAANEDAGVAWLRAPADGPSVVVGRHHPKQTTVLEEEATISQPSFGAAAPDGHLEMATSRLGDLAVGFLQGGVGDRRLVVGTFDRPPGTPSGRTTRRARNLRQPEMIWNRPLELWGPVTFKLFVDGAEVGSTDSDRLTPPAPLSHGRHTWYVTATDRRGQTSTMAPRPVVVDLKKPRLSVRITGARRRGASLRVRIRATDPSGIRRTRIDFGDGTVPDKLRDVRHIYRRSGRRTLEVRALDRAGNLTRRKIRLRIR